MSNTDLAALDVAVQAARAECVRLEDEADYVRPGTPRAAALLRAQEMAQERYREAINARDRARRRAQPASLPMRVKGRFVERERS